MLVLQGKSRNRSMSEMVSSKVVYRPPTLFSIFLSAMLDEAFRDMGMASTYSPDKALLFNVANFRAKSKITLILMRELLFADDSAPGCTLC